MTPATTSPSRGGSPYRPPRDCPVCAERLEITQLGCSNCGTGLSGRFRPCEFCGLEDADREVLRVFLASRGNMKDLERHLGVSYPTARARFDDLLRKLGIAEPAATPAGAAATPPGRSARPAEADRRLDTLRALAAGDLDVQAARAVLADESE